jgi:large subunit ribosomal protein L18
VKHEKVINKQRKRRGFRVRNRIKRDSVRPRLSVFRSHKHLYAQVIDDEGGRTLASASTTDKELREKVAYGGNVSAAQVIGEAIAKRALEAGVKQVAFDRREYKYHGRVAALADAARDAGLDLGAKKEVVAKKEPAKKDGKKKGEAKGKGDKKKGDAKAKAKSKK